MFKAIRNWLDRRVIRQSDIPENVWQSAFAQLPVLNRLTGDERARLRDLAILLIHKKQFTGARGLHTDQPKQLLIALQACLPILNLGMSWYRNWRSIIVYPENFATEATMVDEAGISHKVRRALSGEAWERGPVILSWSDTVDAGEIDGSNLVIHEFVHKLDMLNGRANGFPPLHNGMSKRVWTSTFSDAFEDFTGRLFDGDTAGIDPYAGHSPAEFLAVLSEVFFERPELVHDLYPEVHEQMVLFFRQNPGESFG